MSEQIVMPEQIGAANSLYKEKAQDFLEKARLAHEKYLSVNLRGIIYTASVSPSDPCIGASSSCCITGGGIIGERAGAGLILANTL